MSREGPTHTPLTPTVDQANASPSPTQPTNPPCLMANFNKEYSAIASQDNYDGFRLEANKQTTKFLLTSHTLFLGTQLRPDGAFYQFGPTFTSKNGDLFLMARTGFDGTVTARSAWNINPFYTFKLNMMTTSLSKMMANENYEISLDRIGHKTAQSGRLIWDKGWNFDISHTQKINENLQVAGMYTNLPPHNLSVYGVGGRFTTGDHCFSAQVTKHIPKTTGPNMKSQGLHTLRAQYFKKVNSRLSMGTELEVSDSKDSALKMAFEYFFRNARIQGLVDTSGKVSIFTQEFSAGLGVSGVADYFHGDYKFGFMMHLAPQNEG